MNARAAQALSLETRLRKAVEAQQFVLHYQPKIELASGAICGVEALIRWQEPGTGLVPPGIFIPLLEETGLILEVGKWALSRRSVGPPRMDGARLPRAAHRRQRFGDTAAAARISRIWSSTRCRRRATIPMRWSSRSPRACS